MNQHVPPPHQERHWPNWWGLVAGRAPCAAVMSFDSPIIDSVWWYFENKTHVYTYVVTPPWR